MRAASLHRFLPSPYALRRAVSAVPLMAALVALLALGAAGVGAWTAGQSFDVIDPFRWN